MRSGGFLPLLSISCCLIPVFTLLAAPPDLPEADSGAPLRFRRLLVPEELIPSRFQDYRPIKRETFEAEIQRINDRATRASQTTARVVRATYHVRLASNDLLSGDAMLEVSRTEPETAVLSLTPCSVALGSFQWREDAQTPIPLGTVPTGELLALVDRDGTLQFSWSARGTAGENGVRVFSLALPRSAATQLILELPENVVPTADKGVVIAAVNGSLSTPTVSTGPGPLRKWELELGGHTEFNLRLVSQRPTADKVNGVRLRESVRYRITASGLELRANLRLTAQEPHLEQLILEGTPGLYIAAVQAGDRMLPLARPAGASHGERVQVVLDEPLSGSDQELVVLAVAPLVLGTPWELPAVRPKGAVWQEGQAVIEVVEPLLLAGLRVRHGIETKIEPLPAPEQGESRDIQFWQPDGHAEVQLAYPPHDIVAEAGAAIRFNERAAIGRLVVDLQARQGTSFTLHGRVSSGWTIDSVQTEPPDALESFSTRGGGPRQDLTIHFRRAIPTDQRWRIVIRAHRRTPRLDQPLRAEVARMVAFPDLKWNTRLVALSADPPLRMVFAGDEQLQRLDPQSLPSRQAESVTPAQDAVIFYDQPVTRDWSVTLSREQPRFTAQLSLAAEVDATQLTESYELRCEPNQSHVSRLLVHLSRGESTSLEWTLVDAGDNRLSTRLLDTAGDGIGGESWELGLSRPLNRPFVVRATRRQPLLREATLSFASLPEASSQTGILQVHAIGCGPLEVRVRNLQPISVNRPQSTQLPTLRGAYRFAPSQEVAATIVRLPNSDATPAAWLWLLDTRSRCDVQGEMEHETRMLIENTGLGSIAVELPSGANLVRVAVDRGVLPRPVVTAGRLTIPLPKDQRFPMVRVSYRSSQQRLGWVTSVRPVTLSCDLPALQRRASVWIPEGYVVLGEGGAVEDLTWDQRLFGARLWRRDQRPFDVFSRSDWGQLRPAMESFAGAVASPDRSTLQTALSKLQDRFPWPQIEWSIGSEESACGWSAFESVGGTSRPTEWWIYRRGIAYAASGGLLLAVAGIVASASWLTGRSGLVGLTLLAAVTLLVPAEFVPASRAAFLGAILGFLWRRMSDVRTLRPVPTEISSRQFSVHRDLVVASTNTGAMLLLSFWMANCCVAQEPAAPEPAFAEASTTFNVLSPIDDKQQPKGDYLFVPQAMYDALQRRALKPIGGVQGAWLESAEYHVTLATGETEDPRLLPREFSMEYTWRTFQTLSNIRIPWRRERFRILEVTLDGQPLPVAWSEVGNELPVILDEIGQHRLRIVARPLQSVPETAGEFVASILRSPRSRVVVHAAGSLDRLSAVGAASPLSRNDAAGELSADLFPADSLHIRWSAPALKTPMPVDSEVSELLWLRADGTALTVDGKFQFASRNGRLSQVSLLVDRDWRLLPVGKEQPVAMVEVVPGEQQTVRCWLDRPYDEVTLQLSFALEGSSGMGLWDMPRISAQATRRSPTWLALSAGEGLSAELSSATAPARIVPSEFLAAWNETRDPPQQAIVLAGEIQSALIAVRPLPPRIGAQEQQDVLVGSERASFRYEAVVTAEQGRMAQIRIEVPAGFEPREIIALHDDANRLLRWSRVSDQVLSVFLTSPLSGEVRLVVQGDCTLPQGNRVRLPLLALANASSTQYNVNLFQEPDVSLEVTASPGLQPAARNASHTEWRRWVTSLAAGPSTGVRPALELLVRPNRPRVAGSIVTTMSFSDDQWQMEAALHLEILEGSIDEVRLHLPPELPGQIQRNPPGELRIQPAPGEGGRLLIARFPAPIEHELKLTLSGDLTMPVGDPIRVPELRVLDGISLKRYVVLPTRLQRQKATWEISGLQSTELPEELASPSIPGDAAVFQVVGPRVQAVLREVERLTGTPQVHLADYQLRWANDGQVRGLATFYLEPSRLGEIDLALPIGTKPLHFSVAGLPVFARPGPDNHWRVPVGPELLPQLVEVLYEATIPLGKNSSPAGEIQFPAPAISGIPVTQTLWTVQGPPDSTNWRPTLSHTVADPRRLDEYRRQTTEFLRKRGLADTSQSHPGDRDAWRADWDARLRQIDRRLPSSNGTDAGSAEVVPLELPVDLASRWLAESKGAGPQVHCVLRGAAPLLGVQFGAETWRELVARGKGLVLLLALVAGGSWLARLPAVRECWARLPQLFIAAVGLGWWLFCVPSILGLIILVLGAVSALRPRWKAQVN